MFRIVREARSTAWRVAFSQLSEDSDDSSITFTIDIVLSSMTLPERCV
jgi:hypothetical protein